MDKTSLRFGLAGLLALTAFQGSVSAQATPAPAPAAAAPAAEPAPMPAPAPEAAPAPEPAPMAETQPAEMGPMPEPSRTTDVTGWFRIDDDKGGLQLWAGATHPIGDLSLASDIYVVGATGEFDLGLTFTVAEGLSMTPMVGYTFDFGLQQSANLALPQLYTIYDGSSLYLESWIQVFFLSPFVSTATDYLHTRDFLLYKASHHVALGLEVDAEIALKNPPFKTDGTKAALYFLPVGPHFKIHYGAGSTLELFAGYDVMAKDQGKHQLAGRFTFVQTW
jgi:hypothetical protein